MEKYWLKKLTTFTKKQNPYPEEPPVSDPSGDLSVLQEAEVSAPIDLKVQNEVGIQPYFLPHIAQTHSYQEIQTGIYIISKIYVHIELILTLTVYHFVCCTEFMKFTLIYSLSRCKATYYA